jgi:hypothetical protein
LRTYPRNIKLFTVMPLICAQALRNTWDLAMWPPRLGGGAARGNPGDLAGELGWGVAREALGVARDRFVCWFGAERAAGERHGGGRQQPPLEPGLRRAWGSASATRGWGSYRGS